jgi:hypothetical protein
MHQKHKDAIRATQLINRLTNFANATMPVGGVDGKPGDVGFDIAVAAFRKAQLTSAQVSAIQIVLKKLMPDLSSVEQKIVDDRDSLTEDQIFEQMVNLVASNPDLARKLRGVLGVNVR